MAKLFKALLLSQHFFLGCSSFSYWKGLLWGKQLLKCGIGRKIGDRHKVSRREDNQLPGSTSFKFHNPHNIPVDIIRVFDLIDHQHKVWKTSILSSHFSHTDITRILSIPLPTIDARDKLAWLPSTDVNSVSKGFIDLDTSFRFCNKIKLLPLILTFILHLTGKSSGTLTLSLD